MNRGAINFFLKKLHSANLRLQRLLNNIPSAKGTIIALTAILLLNACQKKHHTISRGFYYWKTTYQLNNYEAQRLAAAGCKSIYLRCFDVGWNEASGVPEPVGILRMQQQAQAGFSYVPVVFITQQTIAKINKVQIPALALNTAWLLADLFTKNGLYCKEIQIDCDWTAASRDNYFALLKALKNTHFFSNKKLSCTVRLHQVKYRLRSGIPPADRALVMCYNVGNLKQPGAHNSILDAGLAEDYLAHLDTYPLPVDIALPLFSWCLHFRDGKMVGILRDVQPDAVTNNPLFTRHSGNLYACSRDTVWLGYELHAGDELRAEIPTQADIERVACLTSRLVRNNALSVLFFHTDSITLSKYSTHDLEAVYSAYH